MSDLLNGYQRQNRNSLARISLSHAVEGRAHIFFHLLCAMFASIFEFLCIRWFRAKGWTISQRFPPELKKYVLVVAPHTSNWDFVVGVAARKLLGLNVKYVAKKELFFWPIGGTLKRLGGFPVDRSKKTSFVDQITGFFNTIEDFCVTVTPEGTRAKVDKWKTGFYHMARQAGVPVMTVGFDYEKKVVVVSEPFETTGDMEADIAAIQAQLKGIVPRNPENGMY